MPPAAPPPTWFDSTFLGKLERLHLLSRRIFRGSHRAERRSRQIGSSLEFADYRNYVLGDDLRSVDWNTYGRLERLFVRLFEQEQDLPVYLLIDGSASMHWQPESLQGRRTKVDQARLLAAALAYIGLANLDRVDLLWFGADLTRGLGLERGKSHFHQVLRFLQEPPALAGATDLLTAVRAFVQRRRQRGLVFVLSDFFDAAGYEAGLSLLAHERFETHVVQVLDPTEVRPTETGDLRLHDAEGAPEFDVTASPSLLRAYTRQVEAYLAELERFCSRRGLGYAAAYTDVAFEELILRVLRRSTMLA